MTRRWIGHGTEFVLDWGGRPWTLKLDDPRPGLRAEGRGPLLGLEGVAEVGRWDPDALSKDTLTAVEHRFDRIEATYSPPAWGALTVRASWFPVEDDGVELEIQLSAQSVDELRAVEVRVLSTLAEVPPEPGGGKVYPRDVRSAALTYDGRDPFPEGRGMTTWPPGPFGPDFITSWSYFEGSYVELVYPGDVSRRIQQTETLRYGLFGHDLEKGVVLRGRLRGHWYHHPNFNAAIQRLSRQFQDSPLPLST